MMRACFTDILLACRAIEIRTRNVLLARRQTQRGFIHLPISRKQTTAYRGWLAGIELVEVGVCYLHGRQRKERSAVYDRITSFNRSGLTKRAQIRGQFSYASLLIDLALAVSLLRSASCGQPPLGRARGPDTQPRPAPWEQREPGSNEWLPWGQ